MLAKPSLRILTKIQLRNLNQASAVKYWPKASAFCILKLYHIFWRDSLLCAICSYHQNFLWDDPCFFSETSASKSHLSFNFKTLTNGNSSKILTKLQLQNLAWALLRNLNKGTKSVINCCTSSTLTTVTTSTSFELLSSHARVASIKFTKRQSVS